MQKQNKLQNTNNKTRQKKDIQETGWNTTLSERIPRSISYLFTTT